MGENAWIALNCIYRKKWNFMHYRDNNVLLLGYKIRLDSDRRDKLIFLRIIKQWGERRVESMSKKRRREGGCEIRAQGHEYVTIHHLRIAITF